MQAWATTSARRRRLAALARPERRKRGCGARAEADGAGGAAMRRLGEALLVKDLEVARRRACEVAKRT
jgi:hypothetical protein